jgi:hypothetical protein
MNPRERLVDSSNNRLTRALLRSAELDEAPDNTVAKVAFALGLGSTALVTTVTTNAAATAVAGTAAGTTAAAAVPAAGIVTAAGMLKVMAIVGLTCGTLSYGSVKLALRLSEKPAVATMAARVPPPAMRQTPATRAAAAIEPVANSPAPPPPPVYSDLGTAARGQEPRRPSAPEATPPREANAPALGRQAINSNMAKLASPASAVSPEPAAQRTAAVAPPPPIAPAAMPPGQAAGPVAVNSVAGRSNLPRPAADLEREVAQLDQARAALAAGQPVQALRELDAYRVQTPRGTLAAESIVLRVQALLALGQRAAAEREASPLLMAAPQSRHAERLRQLLGTP